MEPILRNEPVWLPCEARYQAIDRKRNESEYRSRTESRKAPNLVILPVALATTPSSMSKKPPMRINTPPSLMLYGIITAARIVIRKPVIVSEFGLKGIRLAIELRGASKK
jgi:hypothetical protein